MKKILILVIVAVVAFVGYDFASNVDWSKWVEIFKPGDFKFIYLAEKEGEGVVIERPAVEEEMEEVALPEVPKEPILPPAEREGSVSIAHLNVSHTGFGRLVLRANLNEGEKVNITGWKVVSNKGSFLIPRAVNNYQPDGVNPETDIVLESRQEVEIFFPLQSPLGKNIRFNKCTGYLNNSFDFDPPIPNDCPLLPEDSYKHLSDKCQSILRELDRCELPDFSEFNKLPVEEGNACRQFALQNITAGACYKAYSGDADFLGNIWRVWINKLIFDQQHDWVRLLNKNGKIISEERY